MIGAWILRLLLFLIFPSRVLCTELGLSQNLSLPAWTCRSAQRR